MSRFAKAASAVQRLSWPALGACALLVACSDRFTTSSAPASEGLVANAGDPSLYRANTAARPSLVLARATASVLASNPTARVCSRILLYDDNTQFGHARNAVTAMGLTYTRAVSSDFKTKLTGEAWDLVIMDLPSTEPSDVTWQTSLADYIAGGGRAIHTHWNTNTLTSGLQSAFQISSPLEHETQSFYQWNSHSLFTTPNDVPTAFDVWTDAWGTNGFDVQPTGTAVAAAGTTTSPATGRATIVIGNDSRTIFNGLLFDDYQPADKDADAQKDIEELIQNEVELVCGGSAVAPSAPTITGITPGNGQLSVAFTAPSSDGGSTITNYEYSTDNGMMWTARSPSQTTSPIVIAGLTNGTEYQVRVRAVNAVGAGAASPAVAATPMTVPSAPTITGITAGDGRLSVDFTPPSDDGGSAITNYEYSTNGGVLWTVRDPVSTASPIVITGLTNGSEYHVTIRAVNSVGAGAPSNTVSATPGTESTKEVPAGEPATVTVEDSCDAEADGQCAVAGVDIPENTFNEDVTVSVRFVRLQEGEKCHEYLLAQNNLCVEVDVRDDQGNEPTLNNNVIVGFCLPTSVQDLEMYKFESRSSRPMPLRQVTADFLECDGFQTSSAKPSNWLHGLALGVSKQVGKWISPKLAYAADRGFGGEVEKDGSFSFFTWAAPLQLTDAGLAVNVFNSGKDAFGFSGVFGLAAKGFAPFSTEAGFSPTQHPVTVLFGDQEETLTSGTWKSKGHRWQYTSSVPLGVNFMEINTSTGEVVVGGRVPTEADAFPKYRQFTIRLGNRIRGLGLLCGTSGRCSSQH